MFFLSFKYILFKYDISFFMYIKSNFVLKYMVEISIAHLLFRRGRACKAVCYPCTGAVFLMAMQILDADNLVVLILERCSTDTKYTY